MNALAHHLPPLEDVQWFTRWRKAAGCQVYWDLRYSLISTEYRLVSNYCSKNYKKLEQLCGPDLSWTSQHLQICVYLSIMFTTFWRTKFTECLSDSSSVISAISVRRFSMVDLRKTIWFLSKISRFTFHSVSIWKQQILFHSLGWWQYTHVYCLPISNMVLANRL